MMINLGGQKEINFRKKYKSNFFQQCSLHLKKINKKKLRVDSMRPENPKFKTKKK